MDNVYLTLEVLNEGVQLEILDYNEFRRRRREYKLSIILELREKYTLEYILENYDFISISAIKYYTMSKLICMPDELYFKIRKYKLLNDEIYELILRMLVTPIVKEKVSQFNLSSGSCIYALKLESDYFYVGYSNQIDYRLTTHILRLTGTSRLIKYHYVEEILEIKNGTEEDENKLTEYYKEKYGDDKAEGGKWCSMKDYKDRYGVRRNNKKIVYIDIL